MTAKLLLLIPFLALIVRFAAASQQVIDQQVIDQQLEHIYDEPTNLIATVQFSDYKTEMFKLNQLHLDVAGVDIKNQLADVVINDHQFKLLKDLGFNVKVTMSKFLMRAPDKNYKTSSQIEALLKKYHEKFPALTKVIEVGKTLRGNTIFAIKISSNPDLNDPTKPDILFNGMHHAREVMGPEVALDIIDQLLENYGRDQKVTSWVNRNEIWVMPMFNVDGNNLIWSGNPMWRKNARENYGVDINRNYPYAWGSCNGSSSDKNAQDYRGPAPASEPETQVMMNFVKTVRPVFDISYHSYSELVIYPKGCNGQRAQNADVVEPLGQAMAKTLGYTAGTAWETLYSVDGGDIDWMNDTYQVIPFVIEVNSRSEGFQPPYSTTRDKTVERNRKAWQILLDRLDGPGVRGTVQNQGKSVQDFSIQVQKQNGFIMKDYMTYKGNADGSYHLVLNPGTYSLKFTGPNLTPSQAYVTISEERVEQNIEMN